MNKENIEILEKATEHDSPKQGEELILKVVRIENNQPKSTVPSSSCDNCSPWTSCCDSY